MKLILIRHGQSEANLANLFTGWFDSPLTDKGKADAYQAGCLLKAEGIKLDAAYSSLLSRAIQTTYFVLSAMDQLYLPYQKDWRLNGRHYGALEGHNKQAMKDKYGPDQVHAWRRTFDVRPPLDPTGIRDPRYRGLDQGALRAGESLKDTLDRVAPYWQDTLAPALKAGQNILVVGHGNGLRALVKYIENISDDAIESVEIPNAQPIVYEFGSDLMIQSRQILKPDQS
ncbi:2,3-bisphosphoglycerate-dependent phosphoglycerate mutase [Aerococcus sp. UMB10185]|uniref:2,3-bisphosphoglycerate-dependent phosphoglycerate mutase n=1 Tax=unclassified Aerococcus TaxID=2618060 RepID=UPI0008A1BF6F|nr:MULTISPECIES: 2,3-bisphosphoglycerate-dependent phosphoglycerate mutase [unclassified Aerococcus]MDK6233700.1 2,3-bisphosphoglycerate-dependent phosphoglycerate mutase [Aerococcus sp. UMB10185]MDK6855945.1 2,3-bisphosphoglycerate-dependent phosphoglycerate mutase [Aerococcus sp. UMB7533]OFN03768.1 phosphoglyceromutase [Aerococcus sp. HMSC062A02]OHO43636.1 phosphoglyceromutase [Aerococcus sp. HMSC035B07]